MDGTAPYFPPFVQGWQEIFWMTLNPVMFMAWWIFFAGHYAKDLSLSERLLAAFIASVGQVLLCVFITGWLHIIGWYETVGLCTLITLIILFTGQVSVSGNTFDRELKLLVIGIWKLLRSSAALWVIGILALFAAGWYFYLGQLLPPACWDAWGYHLTWAALAHQERHLGPFDYPNPYVNYFPKNTDILFLWSIIGAGTERWADIIQGIFGIAGVSATYRLARIVGARPRDAVVSSLLLLSVPIFIHMQWKAMVDLAVMGGGACAIAFLARQRLTVISAVLAGIASGFIVGSKGSAVYIYVSICVFLLYRCLPLGMNGFMHRAQGRFKYGLLVVVVFLLVSLAYGSYFYMRNWVQTGNPTGYYHVEIAGITFFEGTEYVGSHFSRELLPNTLFDALKEGSEWLIVLDGFFDPQAEFTQGNRIGGWGAVWTVLLLPSIPIVLIWALISRKWRVIAVILVCLLPFFLFKYNHTWLRYHLIVLSAGAISFGFFLSLLERTKLRKLLLAVAGVMMALTLFISGNQTAITPGEISDARKKPYQLSDQYIYFNSWHNPGFAQALNSVKLPGTTLAAANFPPNNRQLAFWNQYFTNRLVWVEWEEPGDEWYNGLLDAQADYVYVSKDSDADNFAVLKPECFRTVYSANQGSLYEILEPDDNE